jgi:hypothetical protein
MNDQKCVEYMNRMKDSQTVDDFFDITKELVNTKAILPYTWFIKFALIILNNAHRINDKVIKCDVFLTIMDFMMNNYSNWSFERVDTTKLFYTVFWKVHEFQKDIEEIDIPQNSKQKFIQIIQDMQQRCFPIHVVKRMCPHAFMSSFLYLYNLNNGIKSWKTNIIIKYLENMKVSNTKKRDPTYVKNVSFLKNYIKTLHGDNREKWNSIFRLYVQLSIENHCLALTRQGGPCTLTSQSHTKVCITHMKRYKRLYNTILKHTKFPIDLVHLTVRFAL